MALTSRCSCIRPWLKHVTDLGVHQGPGVLSVCPVGEVGTDGVEQAGTSGSMRFSQPHDRGGSPCLPTHHPRFRRAWPRCARSARSNQLNRHTCSPTWPRSATPGPALGAGTRWPPSLGSPLLRSWRVRGRSPPSPSGPRTHPVVCRRLSRRPRCGSGRIAWLGCRWGCRVGAAAHRTVWR